MSMQQAFEQGVRKALELFTQGKPLDPKAVTDAATKVMDAVRAGADVARKADGK